MLNKLLDWVCGLLGALALFAIMTLTFLDVGARKILSNSITGSLELTELLMVVVIFSAMPLVSRRGEHVVFDSLDGIWPHWFKHLQNALVHLLCAAMMLGLAYLMWKLGLDIAAQHRGQRCACQVWGIVAFAQMCSQHQAQAGMQDIAQ